MTVRSQYNTYGYSGAKWVVLTTSGPLGGRNATFGIVWLVVGVCYSVALVVVIALGRKRLAIPTGKADKDFTKRTKFLHDQLSWVKSKRK